MGKLRLIDTWYYDLNDVEQTPVTPAEPEDEEDENAEEPEVRKRIVTKKIEIKVHLEKDTVDVGGPPYALKEVKFIVSCKEPKFKFQGTDIEALRYAAFENLNEAFKIKWEKYFLVTVNHANDYGVGLSTGLTFSYNDVEKGTTWDGKELLRQFEWRGERVVKPWPGRFEDKGGRAIACIPKNDANEAALEEFRRRIDVLREMIRDTIRPEQIIQTLANLSQLALLPPAPEESEDETREANS